MKKLAILFLLINPAFVQGQFFADYTYDEVKEVFDEKYSQVEYDSQSRSICGLPDVGADLGNFHCVLFDDDNVVRALVIECANYMNYVDYKEVFMDKGARKHPEWSGWYILTQGQYNRTFAIKFNADFDKKLYYIILKALD